MYFESHAHYDDNSFDDDRDALLSAVLPEAGVSFVNNVGAGIESSRMSVRIAEKYDHMCASVGVHPHYVSAMNGGSLTELKELSKSKKVVAVGEIGLDFYYNYSPRDEQLFWFKEQLRLADTLALPVIIHSRDADDDVFKTLCEWGGKNAVVHSFCSGAEMAVKYVEMGYYIGFSGMVAFKKANEVVEAVKVTPLERILIETDCPYLSPPPNRGKRNDSRNLKYIVERIAEIKGIGAVDVENVTYENAVSFFSIKKLLTNCYENVTV